MTGNDTAVGLRNARLEIDQRIFALQIDFFGLTRFFKGPWTFHARLFDLLFQRNHVAELEQARAILPKRHERERSRANDTRFTCRHRIV